MNFNEKEKRYMAVIESNLKHFNQGRRKRLDVHYYVSDGNKALVLFGGETIAATLDVIETFYFIFGFIKGRESK